MEKFILLILYPPTVAKHVAKNSYNTSKQPKVYGKMSFLEES